MPIDANVYARYLPEPTRLETLGELAQARDQRQIGQQNRQITDLKLKAATREENEATRLADQQTKLQGIFQRNTGPDGPNQKAILAEAYRDVPDLAPKIAEHFIKIQKDARDEEVAGIDLKLKKLDLTKKALEANDEPIAKALNLLSLAETPEDATYAYGFAKLHGVDDDLKGMGFDPARPFTPDIAKRAGATTQTPQQRAVLAKEAATPQGSDYARFEADYLAAEAAKKGKTPEQLSPPERVTIKTAARKAFGQADDAAYRGLAPIVIQTANGPQLVDRAKGTARGIEDETGTTLGLAPTADARNRQMGRQSAQAVLTSIDELSAKINTGQGAMSNITGTVEKAKAQANLNDDMSEYQAVVSGFTPLLARALGHTGVLTEQDVQSVREMLPKPIDSKNVRDRKIARIKTIMAAMPEAIPGAGAAKVDTTTTPKIVTTTQLTNIAKMKGTSVDAERKRAEAAGYTVQ